MSDYIKFYPDDSDSEAQRRYDEAISNYAQSKLDREADRFVERVTDGIKIRELLKGALGNGTYEISNDE